MNNQPFKIFTCRLLAAATFLALLCTASASEKKAVTIDLKEVRQELTELQGHISDTIAALEVVKKTAKSKGDLTPPFTAFQTHYQQLQAQIDTVRSHANLLRARADDHYRAWQDELSKMGNPKLREKALDRYDDAKEEFDEIIVIAQEVKRDLDPFMTDLRDVSSYLSTDLSNDAVKSLSNTIFKLGNKSRSLIGGIKHVNGQIEKALEAQPEAK
ncbi:MAG TPA: DUF2959 family protein [Verrucomicrobiae bacterium]